MNTNIVPINMTKRALRGQLLEARKAINAEDKARLDQILCHQIHQHITTIAASNQTVALYFPIRNEPDLTALVSTLWADNFQVALPIVVEKNAPLKFATYTPSDVLQSNAWGIFEPSLDQSRSVYPDVIIIPCLGIHSKRYRLGYGGGFYDRTLAMYQEIKHIAHTIGVGYAQCEFEIDPFDVPLDAVFLPIE